VGEPWDVGAPLTIDAAAAHLPMWTEWGVANYAKLSDKAQTRLPLRPIYFLAPKA
jgi:hypothetical protein